MIVTEGQITGTQLAERLLVNPETGSILACRDTQKQGRKLAKIGYIKPGFPENGGGYRIINFAVGYRKYKKIRAHHIVWAWVHGEWPKGHIDHINLDRDDNRIENLRLATPTQNKFNRGRLRNNKSGFKWCYQAKNGDWVAQVERPKALWSSGKREWAFRSRFSTLEDAYEAACTAAKKLHGDFYNPGTVK